MKIEWSVTDVTAIGSSGRAEHAILGVILAGRVFGQFRACLWSLSHFVIYEGPLELSPYRSELGLYTYQIGHVSKTPSV